MQAQIIAMQQELDQLRSTAPNHSSTTPQPLTSSRKGFKVAPPDIFDGTVSKSAAFLSQLSLFFHGRRNDFETDDDKIICALSYMKGGTAGPWANAKVKAYKGGVSDTLDAFLKQFQDVFGDPDPAGTARHKLSLLKQESQTADEYVSAFREFKDDTGYNDAALVDAFEKGLNQALVDSIYKLPEMPQTLEGWINWAVKLDRQYRQREAKKKVAKAPIIQKATPKPFSPIVFTPSKPRNPTPLPVATTLPARQADSVPMEIDSGMKTVKPRLCWRCKQPGHIASQCRSGLDVNSMNYDEIKAFVKGELEKENDESGF